jgi:hypothetical protein
MSTLWIFGDSYSEPFSKTNDLVWKKEYIKWKGYCPKYFADFIVDDIDYDVKNYAIGGADNYTIFESIIPFLDRIKSDDTIIIGWSDVVRFRVVNKYGTFNTIRPVRLDIELSINKHIKYLDFSEQTLKELIVNRDNDIYYYELNNTISFLNFVFKSNKLIHWSPFFQPLINTTINYPTNLEVIRNETNGNINDGHYSENAHKVLSKLFIEYITNGESVIANKSIL